MIPRSSWLAALGAFESAARQQNFARAGAELHLTASAVSHHVRKLESQLGVALFQRHARGVTLTPEGRLLADAAANALGDVDAAIESLQQGTSVARVRVTMLPSFAACWFAPRMARFSALRPQVRITLETDRTLSRFEQGGPDLGIRYGLGQWQGLTAHFLMDDAMFPAAAPTLPGLAEIRTPADIARLPLIADLSLQGWRDWFRFARVRGVRLGDMHNIADSSDAMDAAAGGLGAILARRRLATAHLASARLVRLPGPSLATHYAYYVVYPAHRKPGADARAFVGWLLEEARHEQPLSDETG